jgi:hypothetical protein
MLVRVIFSLSDHFLIGLNRTEHTGSVTRLPEKRGRQDVDGRWAEGGG